MATASTTTSSQVVVATSSTQLPLVSLCETVAKINMPTMVQSNAVVSSTQQQRMSSATFTLTSTGLSTTPSSTVGENVYKLSLSNGEVHTASNNSVTKIVPAIAAIAVSRSMEGSSAPQKPIIVTVANMHGLGAKQLTSVTNVMTAPMLSAPVHMVAPHFVQDKIPSSSSIITIPRSSGNCGTTMLSAASLQNKPKTPSHVTPLIPGSIITSKGIGQMPVVIANANSSFLTSQATSSVPTTITPVTYSSSIVTVTPVIMTSTSSPLVSIAANSAIAVNHSGASQPQVLTPIIQGAVKAPLVTGSKNMMNAFLKPVTMTAQPPAVVHTQSPATAPSVVQPSLAAPVPITPASIATSTVMHTLAPASVAHNPNETASANGSNPKSDPMNPDFDPVHAMTWKDGIGSLPGSDLRFKISEFGTLEIVTDNAESSERSSASAAQVTTAPTVAAMMTVKDSLSVSQPSQSATPTVSEAPEPTTGRNSLKESFSKMKEMYQTDSSVNGQDENGADDSKSDVTELCRCENCDCFGLKVEFWKSGRFCSQTCYTAYSNRRNSWLKRGATKDLRKKKRRKSLGSDDEESSVKELKIDSKEAEAKEVKKDAPPDMPMVVEFNWEEYLKKEKAIAAPSKLFFENQTFPLRKNGFEVGMKLEGIDPKHPSLFCVLTVAEVRGFRIRLHFDGYSERYDFWVNADSSDIFPVGWCEKTGHKLQPPKGFTIEEFNWDKYLNVSKKFKPAPKHLFTVADSKPNPSHGFRLGMKLEAVDKKNSSLVCVATVADVMDNRFLIHFDGWEDIYDYWAYPHSPSIHPINWCKENGHELTPPKEYKGDNFCWQKYLNETKTVAVPTRCFKQCSSNNFKAGMKIEAVDKRNPLFIRVATIADRTDNSLLIHFDGWSSAYDYWVDDDCPDIHPIHWCSKTGHPLEGPVSSKVPISGQNGCPTPGCPGLGHMKGPRHTTHHSAFGCPYSYLNINKYDTNFQDRVIITRDILSEIGKVKSEQSGATEGLRRCPTPGCNGAGHVKGKYSVHHGVSGCPLAALQESAPASPVTSSSASSSKTTAATATNNNNPKEEKKPSSSSSSFDGLRTRSAIAGRGKKKKVFGTGMRGRPPKALVMLRAQQAAEQKREESRSNSSNAVSESEIHKSVFESPFTNNSNDCPDSWDRIAKALPDVDATEISEVKSWSVDEVAKFVANLTKSEELSKVFVDQLIDGEAFVLLNQEDMINIMKLKLGPTLKIFTSILHFRKQLLKLEDS